MCDDVVEKRHMPYVYFYYRQTAVSKDVRNPADVIGHNREGSETLDASGFGKYDDGEYQKLFA